MLTHEEVLRLLRTLRSLTPLQVLSRLPRRLLTAVPWRPPGGLAPRAQSGWPALPVAYARYLAGEARRARERLARLPDGKLRAFEASYGLGLPVDGARQALALGRDAWHPFPAAVRARNLAVALRAGHTGLVEDLAQACRAVLLQLEFDVLGNHLLEDALGLLAGSLVTRGAESALWWQVGRAILDWQLPQQFLPDGGHFERSATYHLWLTAALLQVVELARAADRELPPLWLPTVERALRWLRKVRAPDGSYPLFNDAALDGAPSIDEVLALAEVVAPGLVAPRPSRPAVWVEHLPDTGWVLAGNRAAWLALDAGPDGAPAQPGHVHADALTFELWVQGERSCVDYGVESYVGPGRERTRATRSHNTVEVAGTDSCEVWGSFRVGRRQRAQLRRVTIDGERMVVVAAHDGYRWLAGRTIHARSLTLCGDRLEVEDQLEGGVSHQACSRLRIRTSLVPSASRLVTCQEGLWFPRLHDQRAAHVYEQPMREGRARWQLGWT